MPLHLRWELYPVATEGRSKAKYGGSYFEESEYWKKPRQKHHLNGIWEMAKKYLTMWGYYRRVRSYWVVLYPWHIGFLLIVLFHGLALIGAIFIKTIGLDISGTSGNVGGLILYYFTIIVALASFTLGTIGSIGLLIKRTVDKELNEFTTGQNYFNYVFFLSVFVSGLVAYFTSDPTYSGYRTYWVGLISLQGTHIAAAEYVHIMLFSLFLIYLPFTRSTHYVTKIMAFFGIRWDDAMNVEGSKMEAKIAAALNLPVSWSASHIQAGKSWGENAMGLPEETGTAEGK